MLENEALPRRVVDPAGGGHYAAPFTWRQRPRCCKKRRRVPEFLMPASPPTFAWAARASLAATLLPLLAGCGPARNQFAPPCPRPAFLGDAANLDLYRPASGAPGG